MFKGIISSLILFIICLHYLNASNASCNDKYCLYYGGTVDGPNSHEEARTLCSQNNSNGWLLEVYDEEVSQLVDKFVEGHKNNLESILLNTKILNGDWKWTNNKTFANPSSIADYEDGIVSTIRFVNNLHGYTGQYLTAKKLPMCQIEGSYKCEGTDRLKYKDSCYFPLEVASTWFVGQNECHKAGGRLAVFDGVDFKDVNKKWFKEVDSSYWVGLTRYLVVWSKGNTFITFNKWKDGFPQNNIRYSKCITINSKDNNTWINLKCDQTFSVVCMGELPIITTASPTTTTTHKTVADSPDKPQIALWVALSVTFVFLIIIAITLLFLIRHKKLPCLKNPETEPKTEPELRELVVKPSEPKIATKNEELIYADLTLHHDKIPPRPQAVDC